MSNVMSKFGDFCRDHKGKIIVAAGVIGAVVIGGLLSKSDDSEKQEINVEPEKAKLDWDIMWVQSNDPNKNYTIDLSVSENETIEDHLSGLKEDLETGNWHKADL